MVAHAEALMVEQIAAFASRARAEDLRQEIRALFKRNILDSLGCALGALPGKPFAKLREQFDAVGRGGRCTLIGGGQTSLDQAALYNSGLVRYLDLLDTYMGPAGLCHPSDNFGGILATADMVGATGEEFMLALAVAYEIGCRVTAAVPVMAKGFNHALQLALSLAAACGKLMNLTPGQSAHAIAIAGIDNISLVSVPKVLESIESLMIHGRRPDSSRTADVDEQKSSEIQSRLPKIPERCYGRGMGACRAADTEGKTRRAQA